jgi:hypothetical protein
LRVDRELSDWNAMEQLVANAIQSVTAAVRRLAADLSSYRFLIDFHLGYVPAVAYPHRAVYAQVHYLVQSLEILHRFAPSLLE